jgi:hypothetical protein
MSKPLELAYRHAKVDSIRRAEAKYLTKEPRSEIILAATAVLFEGILAFILSLPAGLPIAAGTAMIPIISGVVIARYQSDHFDVPEAAQKLSAMYTQALPENITELEALNISLLDSMIYYVSGEMSENPTITDKNRASAKLRIDRSKLVIRKIKSKEIEVANSIEDTFQNDIVKLNTDVPHPNLPVQGLTPEMEQALIKDWKEEWISSKQSELRRLRDQDLSTVRVEFGNAISYWQEIRAQGEQDLSS